MKLAIFDVDGTLSDSQAQIFAAMQLGFAAVGLPVPPRAEVLGIVGLSLPIAVARLAPAHDSATQAAIVEGYKASYLAGRSGGPAPLFPGAAACLHRLAGRGDLRLAVATGKSRRGLDALLAHHRLDGLFTTLQVADDHPSKPHPAMILAALDATGVAAADAVMIGDTTFDVEMGRAAGVATIGVSWGYHPVADLVSAGAGQIVDSFPALEAALDAALGAAAITKPAIGGAR